jgi:hypothetical protein
MLYGPVIKNRFTENEMSAGPPQILLLGVTNLNERTLPANCARLLELVHGRH